MRLKLYLCLFHIVSTKLTFPVNLLWCTRQKWVKHTIFVRLVTGWIFLWNENPLLTNIYIHYVCRRQAVGRYYISNKPYLRYLSHFISFYSYFISHNFMYIIICMHIFSCFSCLILPRAYFRFIIPQCISRVLYPVSFMNIICVHIYSVQIWMHIKRYT